MILRTVIDYDQFEIGNGLGQNGLNGLSNIRAVVKTRHNDADLRHDDDACVGKNLSKRRASRVPADALHLIRQLEYFFSFKTRIPPPSRLLNP
jgi:hypothetical protein